MSCEVRKLVANLVVSGTTSSYTVAVSGYPANSLNKTTVTNEDGMITETFKDFRGNFVLERVKGNGSTTAVNDTYYAHDNRGLLCMVISPEGSSRLNVASVRSITTIEGVSST